MASQFPDGTFMLDGPSTRLSGALGVLLALGFLSGCVGDGPRPPATTAVAPAAPGEIEEINLLAIPVALNLDARPGVDGFVIKVYANNPKRPKSLSIEEGSLEVLMYDGVPGVTAGASPEPSRTWAYKADDLKRYEVRSSIGPGYELAPAWGDAKPRYDKIAVIVRYTPSKGRVIVSAPSIVSVALK